MKLKIMMIVLLVLLLGISLLQIFNLPPYAGDIFPLYRSGYFIELDRQFAVVADAFVAIKSDARPEIAWSFLSDTEKSHGIKTTVFDHNGYPVPAPAERLNLRNEAVLNFIASGKKEPLVSVAGGDYHALLPLFAAKQCLICHKKAKEGALLGLIKFERSYDAKVYYTSERVFIFIILSIILLISLFFLIKWDPEKHIKELFDKS